jgi:hypothetical protein
LCQTRCEGFPRGCGWLTIPTKEPTDEETGVQERAHGRRARERTRACRPQELIQRDTGSRPRQIDGPHIMKRHAGKKVVNPQWQPFELLRRDLWHRVPFVVNECYRDATAAMLRQQPHNFRVAATARQTHRACTRQFSKSPWYQRGPMPGWATTSNVKKGQHSLSATIISAIVAIHLPSPGRRKAYPSRSSSVSITAELNWARSVAARSRSSALVKQQAIGLSSEPCLMAGSRAERRRSCADTRPFVRNGQKHAPGTPPPMPGESPPRFSGARLARI